MVVNKPQGRASIMAPKRLYAVEKMGEALLY